MTASQLSAPTLTPQAPRRNILPDLLDLVADLSRAKGYCYAQDVALGRMVAERRGRSRPYTPQRIRQVITELADQGELTIDRSTGRRHLIVVIADNPLGTAWTPVDFQSIPRKFAQNQKTERREEKKDNNKHGVVVEHFSSIKDQQLFCTLMESAARHRDRLDYSAAIRITSDLLLALDPIPNFDSPPKPSSIAPSRPVPPTVPQEFHEQPVEVPQQPQVDQKGHDVAPKPPQKPQESPLVAVLVEHGVTPSGAVKLVRDCPPEVIERQVNWIAHRGAKDPAGALVSSIRGNWAAPVGVVSEGDKVVEAEAIKKVHAEAGERAVASYWQGLPDWLKDSHRCEAAGRRIKVPDLCREKLGFSC